MRFLKVLWWVVVIALAAGFAARNWRDVTIDLWGGLQADIKIPVLLALMLLLGFLPAWAGYRARHWRIARRGTPAPVVAAPAADPDPDEVTA
jgi:hypothetical protein